MKKKKLSMLLEKKVNTSWQEERMMASKARALRMKLREGKPMSFQETFGNISL